MRKIWRVAFAALGAGGFGSGAIAAAAEVPDRPPPGSSATGFPSYSRQDVVKVCLSEYGMENSSILDCVARDKDYESALAKIWPDIEGRFKKDCLGRLADERMNSYLHLDRCIRAMEKDAEAPE